MIFSESPKFCVVPQTIIASLQEARLSLREAGGWRFEVRSHVGVAVSTEQEYLHVRHGLEVVALVLQILACGMYPPAHGLSESINQRSRPLLKMARQCMPSSMSSLTLRLSHGNL